uniref:heavy-metal-associated domain-containing protein n=1 Tax=Treponema endosymbiont of Eucomonympha sp. TaxID=1580831 RepID=UPI000A776A04
MTTQTIPIGGMTCAACVGRVEKAIRAVAGVERATVNLATEKASVSYDAAAVRLSAIKAAVEKAGYAVPESAGADADA